MLYTTFTVNEKEYKLRLTAKACVELEKKLGENPLNVFVALGTTEKMPALGDIITILHAALQAYHHNMSLNDTYDLFDKYVDEGHTLVDLLPVIIEVLKESGLIPKDVETKNN